MKKRNIPDENNKKATRGFYAALGISAVMIGSACFFAYGQDGGKGKALPSGDTVVDKRADGIPKTTSYRYTVTTTPRTTTAVVTTAPERVMQPVITVEIPAAEVVTDVPETVTENSSRSDRLENPHKPLTDTGNILAPFSAGELIKDPTTGAWQTHNGTDIKAEVGAEVYAVSTGEIMKIENDALWGVTVVLDHHNGYITKYCGLGTDLSVQEGDTVAGGTLIGVVGGTADIESALEPHLHIELTHNGRYVDPMMYIK